MEFGVLPCSRSKSSGRRFQRIMTRRLGWRGQRHALYSSTALGNEQVRSCRQSK